jgi:hypothetical protein
LRRTRLLARLFDAMKEPNVSHLLSARTAVRKHVRTFAAHALRRFVEERTFAVLPRHLRSRVGTQTVGACKYETIAGSGDGRVFVISAARAEVCRKRLYKLAAAVRV